MAFKINILCAAVILAVTFSHCFQSTDADCTFDKMKMFAAEACEHLFHNEKISSIRHKREFHHRSKSNELNGFGFHHKKHMYAVRRSTFPRGGYLKVAQPHFEQLSQLNIYPMYKSHVHKKHHDEYRHKRDTQSANLAYCCFNNCEGIFCT